MLKYPENHVHFAVQEDDNIWVVHDIHINGQSIESVGADVSGKIMDKHVFQVRETCVMANRNSEGELVDVDITDADVSVNIAISSVKKQRLINIDNTSHMMNYDTTSYEGDWIFEYLIKKENIVDTRKRVLFPEGTKMVDGDVEITFKQLDTSDEEASISFIANCPSVEGYYLTGTDNHGNELLFKSDGEIISDMNEKETKTTGKFFLFGTGNAEHTSLIDISE